MNRIMLFWWWILDNLVFPLFMGTTSSKDDKEGEDNGAV